MSWDELEFLLLLSTGDAIEARISASTGWTFQRTVSRRHRPGLGKIGTFTELGERKLFDTEEHILGQSQPMAFVVPGWELKSDEQRCQGRFARHFLAAKTAPEVHPNLTLASNNRPDGIAVIVRMVLRLSGPFIALTSPNRG
jgi:hypothetical protein